MDVVIVVVVVDVVEAAEITGQTSDKKSNLDQEQENSCDYEWKKCIQ